MRCVTEGFMDVMISVTAPGGAIGHPGQLKY